MRSGIREFITKPIDPELMASAFERVTRDSGEHATQGHLIAVIGAAGGVGATSVATNLAIELADLADGAVALADLDFRFGQVTTMLDLDTTFTIADLCESHEQLEPQVLERALVKHASGLRVLGHPSTFAQAENISAAHCVGVLAGLLNLHEFVVLDGPTRFDMGARAVLDIADNILLIMHLAVPCVRNVRRMLDGMRQVGFNLDRVKLICNRTCRDAGALSLEDVRETLNMKVQATLPDDWATMNSAINLGEPLAVHAPKSRIRTTIRELAERLHRPERQSDEQDTGKRGRIFSKILSDA
jgi:pilus assembly protein CpaE